MKTDLFQSCGQCWVFQICWHIECSTLTALSFRTWNNYAGIPSPPLALFLVMLSKAHLTSHSRMFDYSRVTTPSWLSDPMDCSQAGSSVHGNSQARILQWVAIPFSRGSSWPRDQTQVSCSPGRFFTIWVTREAHFVLGDSQLTMLWQFQVNSEGTQPRAHLQTQSHSNTAGWGGDG